MDYHPEDHLSQDKSRIYEGGKLISKAISNHFHGTTGERRFQMAQKEYEDDIIKERVQGLDLREHPVKHKSSLSIKEIKRRINNRTTPIAYRISSSCRES